MRLQTRQLWRHLTDFHPVKVHCSLLAERQSMRHSGIRRENGIKIEGLEKPVNDISEKEEAPEEDY